VALGKWPKLYSPITIYRATLYHTISRLPPYTVRTLHLLEQPVLCLSAHIMHMQPLSVVALHLAELISAEPFVASEALLVSDRVISTLADQVLP
jgi:hypothetical protein